LDLDWTTFALEAVNFLVLVWILKRFLYKPVLDVIARRRAAIEKALAEARARHAEAEALEGEYRERIRAWEQERRDARDALAREIAAERARLMEGVQAAVEEARRKADVLEERSRAEEQARREEAAVQAGLAFTARLLGRLADADLEARLVRMALEDLGGLPPERLEDLKEAVAATDAAPVVTTAFALPEPLRREVAAALRPLVGDRAEGCAFAEDPALGAGLRVSVGPWVLKGSVKDELEFLGGAAGPAD
jgi:F-type H+-transporting ATPase subunit b